MIKNINSHQVWLIMRHKNRWTWCSNKNETHNRMHYLPTRIILIQRMPRNNRHPTTWIDKKKPLYIWSVSSSTGFGFLPCSMAGWAACTASTTWRARKKIINRNEWFNGLEIDQRNQSLGKQTTRERAVDRDGSLFLEKTNKKIRKQGQQNVNILKWQD